LVRVNDRGPFVDNRIIELSYSAAIKLEMISAGTALVEVTALSYDDPPPAKRQDVPARVEKSAPQDVQEIFVQVGAFGDIDNAKRRYGLLRDSGVKGAFVHKDENRSPALYRIRIGPLRNVDEYDALVRKLANIGVAETHLVTN
jgi:rare lipoprotein A